MPFEFVCAHERWKPRNMDTSATVATWLSFAVTVVGLGSIIAQASTIIDQMDPFHALRGTDHLGVWKARQAAFPWY